MSRTVQNVKGQITAADLGGFRAIASTADVDRDGEVIEFGAFNPLPASIPVHADHVASVKNLVATAVPSYVGGQLIIDATFASDPDAQAVRQKVLDGVLGTVSVVFFNAQRKNVDGVPHITSAELLACDLVTVPSQRAARVLSVRSFNGGNRHLVHEARKQALLAMVDVELDAARHTLKEANAAEVRRTKTEIRSFLRSL
jgi:hypothetical protein